MGNEDTKFEIGDIVQLVGESSTTEYTQWGVSINDIFVVVEKSTVPYCVPIVSDTDRSRVVFVEDDLAPYNLRKTPNTMTITLSLDEYADLLDCKYMLKALYDAGVDNWDGYDSAVVLFEYEP